MTTNQPQTVENFDNLLDLSEYDNMSSFPSPSTSPATAGKNQFPARPSISTIQTPAVPSTTQPTMTGPSHQYELYKQQTGIVPGALASTLAVNQANTQISGYNSGFSYDYMSGTSQEQDLFDFNSAPSAPSQPPSGGLDMDMDFDSPSDSQFLFPGPETINPTAIGGGQESPVMPSQPSNVGRLWPGMHTQAAAMKAQQQQQQQQPQQMMQAPTPSQHQRQRSRTKSAQPTDPIVEQKITQLLNSMRAKQAGEDGSPSPLMNLPRQKKDEEDMDEDERLLASEEGKKLSSKERRQLRNKVSARAFRSRRKEYIGQLESEIANKVSENSDLRLQNRSLADENKRLTDLTRMLLSSPSFSNFLDHLSNNPQSLPPSQGARGVPKPDQRPSEHVQQQQEVSKDANPYATQQAPNQQIGMAMIPEQNVDMTMLNLGNESFNLQPQVFAVTETPQGPPALDTDILSGKTSNFVGETLDSDDDKLVLPAVESAKTLAPEPAAVAQEEPEVFDDDFERDPEFALYHSNSTSTSRSSESSDETTDANIFGGLEPEKVLARYELVDASVTEENALVAMARVQHVAVHMNSALERLERLCL